MENNRGGGPLNCFGILTRQNEFRFHTTTKSINAKFLITFFDVFVIDLKNISSGDR